MVSAPSVVIHDLDVFSAAGRPAEANPELVVDPDAVLPSAVAPERFEPVAGRHLKVFEPACDLQLPKLAPSGRLYAPEPFDSPAFRQGLGLGTLERHDHAVIVTQRVINVKRDTRFRRSTVSGGTSRGGGVDPILDTLGSTAGACFEPAPRFEQTLQVEGFPLLQRAKSLDQQVDLLTQVRLRCRASYELSDLDVKAVDFCTAVLFRSMSWRRVRPRARSTIASTSLGPDLEQDALVLRQSWIFQWPQHTIFIDSFEDTSHGYLPLQGTSSLVS
jgi:hypothetical protein